MSSGEGRNHFASDRGQMGSHIEGRHAHATRDAVAANEDGTSSREEGKHVLTSHPMSMILGVLRGDEKRDDREQTF